MQMVMRIFSYEHMLCMCLYMQELLIIRYITIKN